MAHRFVFQAMTPDHFPMVGRWLGTPEVVRWWGNPDEQFRLVRDDYDHPDMDQFIVALDGRPFGYVQCYRLSTWNCTFGPQPPGTRGIDQFIGEPDMIGRGHGAHFVRQFVDDLLGRRIPRVVTDPDPANLRAVRAYEKAGFERDRVVKTQDGPALVMLRDANASLPSAHSQPS